MQIQPISAGGVRNLLENGCPSICVLGEGAKYILGVVIALSAFCRARHRFRKLKLVAIEKNLDPANLVSRCRLSRERLQESCRAPDEPGMWWGRCMIQGDLAWQHGKGRLPTSEVSECQNVLSGNKERCPWGGEKRNVGTVRC